MKISNPSSLHPSPPKLPLVSSPLYEPTSVLDPHLTSSPSAGLLFPSSTFPDRPPSPDFPIDPLSFLLSDPDPDPPSFPPSPDPLIDLLLRAAQSLEFPDVDLNSSVSLLSRLPLPPSSPSPLLRAASHFKDALLSLLPLPSSPLPLPSPPPLPLPPTPTPIHLLLLLLSSHNSLSSLSPIPHFSSLSSNQTLLESLLPSPSLHLIDFHFSHAAHWSSFLPSLLSPSLPPPSLRITAILPSQSPLTSLASHNLRDFALSLRIPLILDFLHLDDITSIQLRHTDSLGIVLTPNYARQLSVMRFVRRVAPRVVLVVDEEGRCGTGGSFTRRFGAGLEYFGAVMEAVEIGAGRIGVGEEVVRRLEGAVMRPRIFEAVTGAAEGMGDWREMMGEMGMVEREISRFTESQAELLLRRGAVEGFHVGRKEEGGLVLTWKGKELVATSAWRFC